MAVQGPRQLVIVAVDDYFTGDEDFAARIRGQVETVTQWLAAPALDAERRFKTAQSKLGSAGDLRAFLVEQELTSPAWGEAVVVYITGHGVRGPSGRHYLTFGDTCDDRLLGTAFPTSELITQILDSEAEHILVLVDSCFAGSLDSELSRVLEDLSAARRGLKTLGVVATGDFHQSPRVGEFTELLGKVLAKASDESAGFTAPHLSFEEWDGLLRAVGDENPWLIEAIWVWPRSRRDVPSLCLPNPRYVAPEQVVQAPRQPLALSVPVLDQFWLSRASGRTGDSDPGWYFSGRQTLMKRLVNFVSDGEGVLVVTGAAGSGKSALLARLVTLSDPLFALESRFTDVVHGIPEELRPGLGSVDAAVVARGKSSLELIEDLLTAFGRTSQDAPPLQVLLEHLLEVGTALARPVTLVVDGVDEAQQPLSGLSDVILPLARLRRKDGSLAVRLMLGMRSSAQDAGDGKLIDVVADQLLDALHGLLRAGGVELGVPLSQVRTDGDESVEDITAYVRALLQAQESSPYHGLDGVAAQTSEVIARAVFPSFLDARLAAAQLRSAAGVQDTGDREWRERLQQGTLALFRSDLRQVALDTSVGIGVLLSVLRATAFGQGAGLPWADVWPAVASALLGSDASAQPGLDEVIRTVQNSRLVGYLASGEEDGRVTYRPAHQRLAEVLLEYPGDLAYGPDRDASDGWTAVVEGFPGPVQGHRAIAVVCSDLAREAAPGVPHPYVRRYTVAHADAGGVLNDSIMPISLAARESSGTVRARLGMPLPVEDSTRRVLSAAGLIEPYVDGSVDVASRLSSLRFHLATASGSEAVLSGRPPEDAAGLGAGDWMTPVAVQWQPRANVIASPDSHVFTLCTVGTPDGRSLIVAGVRDGIAVWDAASGKQVVQIDTGLVRDVCVIKAAGGRSFLVAAGEQGAGVFDPVSGRRLAAWSGSGAHHVHVLRDGRDRWQVAIMTAHEAVVWHPSDDHYRAVVGPSGRNVNTAAWLRSPEGHMVRLLRDRPGFLLHDPLTGESSQVPLESAATLPMAAAPGPAGYDLLAVARQSKVELLDPFTGEKQYLPVRGGKAVTLTLPDGRRALGLKKGRSLTVWDTSVVNPAVIASFDCEPGSQVTLVALQDGAWGLAATSDEGVLLVRERREDAQEEPRPTAPVPGRPRLTAAVTAQDGRQWVAATHSDGVRLTDPVSGQTLGFLKCSSPVQCLEGLPDLGNGPSVAVSHNGGLVLWQPQAGHAQNIAGAPLAPIACLAARLANGTPVLFVAGHDGIGALDLLSSTWTYFEPPARERVSELVAYPSLAACTKIIGVAKRRMGAWDALSGSAITQIGLPLSAGRGACVVPVKGRAPLVAVGAGREVTLWDVHGWKPVGWIDTPLTTAVAPVQRDDGAWLLATGNGTGLRLWDPLSGGLVHSVLTAAPVTGIAQTTDRGNLLHISGPAGEASLRWHLGDCPV
ncbi:ATP-binding protein [Streptomyces sp. NBC_00094]|uniref:ATP-binding protein n=1 Tax=Streptomyces sp. NBC_00094 TaxID=2903620 RepID=UPI00225AF6E6|nr:ATP-binding protein [Streptomyces sp. NBC_00094]MCX5395365.1 ATP-binding protein [Streptomyces sp. NBC_00094]